MKNYTKYLIGEGFYVLLLLIGINFFNWAMVAALCTWIVVYLEMIISIREDTFSCDQAKHVHMSFLWNWAISIGDMFIFPLINALIISQLDYNSFSILKIIAGCAIGLLASWYLHKQWWKEGEPNKGHILYWEGKKPPRWTLAMMKAGWVHFVFTAAQITLIFIYVFSPVQAHIAIWVGILYGIFTAIQQIQGKIVQNPQASWHKVVFVTLMWLVGIAAITVLKV